MLYAVMPTIPVSDLRRGQSKVISQLDDTPILLTNDGRGAGILVHPRVWNELIAVYQMAMERGILDQRFGESVDWSEVEKRLGQVQREPVA
jgi:hypothetical protein